MARLKVRRARTATLDELSLEEFENQARRGEISPNDEICFPLLTGSAFVRARNLDMYRGLYASTAFNFRHYFSFARVPWLTLSTMLILIAVFVFWQEGAPDGTSELVREGAKAPSLIVELGESWRILSANLLHVSWMHLGFNLLFLLNLGGPTEAIYRRLDYALILFASALGTNLLSTFANPAVSCGASGMVFGVWGAAAVFGIRYRDLLPDKYRKYFLGNVIPYSLFTLYLGFAMPGIDNWGHLGGLISGCVVALLLPPRLLSPQHRFLRTKLATVGVVGISFILAVIFPAGPGELMAHRFMGRLGVDGAIPSRWTRRLAERTPSQEIYAYGNGAEVGFYARLERTDTPTTLAGLHSWFTETALDEELKLSNAESVRVSRGTPISVGGRRGMRIETEIMTRETASKTIHVLLPRGYYRYLLSFSAPRWLASEYEEVFESILSRIRMSTPRTLDMARRDIRNHDSPRTRAVLALELLRAGELDEARNLLDTSDRRFPEARALLLARGELEYFFGSPTAVCETVEAIAQGAPLLPSQVERVQAWAQVCDEGVKERLREHVATEPSR